MPARLYLSRTTDKIRRFRYTDSAGIFPQVYRKESQTVGNKLAKQTCAAFDRFRNDANPLIVRKKFQMKDVYFRRDLPEQEVFRCELAFDTELYVLLLIAAALLLWVVCRICRAVSNAREHRYAKLKYKP